MKKKFTLLMLIAISFPAYQSWAQIKPTYTLTVKNIQYKADTALEFDIYLLHTNPDSTDFDYGFGKYIIVFNTGILNGGTGIYQKVSSQLPYFLQPLNPRIFGNELNLATNNPAGPGHYTISSTAPGTLIVKMRLKSSAGTLNINQNPNLTWKPPFAVPTTAIGAYVNDVLTYVTTPATHFVDYFQYIIPSAPVVGSITQPTCPVPTGTVVLTALPPGNWTIQPGNIQGSTSSVTFSGLTVGTYNYTVTNSAGYTSSPPVPVVINAPVIPTPPEDSVILPTCAVPIGSVILSGLPNGPWTIKIFGGGIVATGYGNSTTISNLIPDFYRFTVTNQSECTSSPSSGVTVGEIGTPGVPTGLGIEPTLITQTSAYVVWNQTPLAIRYFVRYKEPGASTWIVVITYSSENSATISGLTADTDYEVQVAAIGGCGTSAFSSSILFTTTPNLTVSLIALIEGRYNNVTNTMIGDTVKVSLRKHFPPYEIVETSTEVLNASGVGTFKFSNTNNGVPYYVVVRHRNSIETWSAAPQTFISNTLPYNFTNGANGSKAYGNNLILKGTKWCIYSGDGNQDEAVDLTDVLLCHNGSSSFLSGYVIPDMDGNNTVDLSDVLIAYNNSSKFVSVKRPQ